MATEQPFQFPVDSFVRFEMAGAKELEKLFVDAPRVTFYHVRDQFFAIGFKFRKELIAAANAGLDSNIGTGSGGKRLTAEPLTSEPADDANRKLASQRRIRFRVYPKQAATDQPQRQLSELRLESYAISDVALGLQEGGTFTSKSGTWLAIPIGIAINKAGRVDSNRYRPSVYGKRLNRELQFLRFGGRSPKLYEVRGGGTKVEGTRLASIQGTFSTLHKKRRDRRILIPAFQLVRSVRRSPAKLPFMQTWDGLAADRDKRFATAVSRIVQDMKTGKKR